MAVQIKEISSDSYSESYKWEKRSKRVPLHLTTTQRDIMGIHKFYRIANRSVTGTCKNCLCLTSLASSWLDNSSREIGLAFDNFLFLNKFFFFFGQKLLLGWISLTPIVFVQVRFDFSFCCKLGWPYYIAVHLHYYLYKTFILICIKLFQPF